MYIYTHNIKQVSSINTDNINNYSINESCKALSPPSPAKCPGGLIQLHRITCGPFVISAAAVADGIHVPQSLAPGFLPFNPKHSFPLYVNMIFTMTMIHQHENPVAETKSLGRSFPLMMRVEDAPNLATLVTLN